MNKYMPQIKMLIYIDETESRIYIRNIYSLIKGGNMQNTKQIVNSRNYTEELNETHAIIKLLDDIQTGEKSTKESGWLSIEELETALEL